MKKLVIIAFLLLAPTFDLHAKNNRVNLLVGIALTTASFGCLFAGPIITVGGPWVAVKYPENRIAFLGLLGGPILTALSIPIGELALKVLKKSFCTQEEKENKATMKITTTTKS